ncbi:MAG TPA: DNA-processing protein DprA [Myxococcaceae bacterium]|nr:DNA-processing protein DprA [Myxococcaceae bacterium]
MDTCPLPSAERDALLALWAVPGIGSVGLGGMRRWAAGRWADLLDTPARDWVDGLPASDLVRARLRAAGSLRAVADEVRERAARGRMEVLHKGDPAYPDRLAEVRDAPPVLFMRGSVPRPRRRLALVGTRHPEQGFLRHARAFAAAVAGGGAGVVSGAAAGVDRACHLGALDMGGETWAFLGSALDVVDAAQARLVPAILDGGGAVFSELPPGVRASKQTFPRRNRLISGASDAVLVLRAGEKSGAMHTVAAARVQGRPILACPGETWAEAARGCNLLVARGLAQLCIGPRDALRAVGLDGTPPPPTEVEPGQMPGMSNAAARIYALLGREARPVEELEEGSGLDPGGAVSALCELELLGLVLQTSGRRYQRV